MSDTTVSATPISVERPGATSCTCGASTYLPDADRGRRLVRLDRAVDAGQVTSSEAAERRVQLLAR
jgi:hypothetical protein